MLHPAHRVSDRERCKGIVTDASQFVHHLQGTRDQKETETEID